MPGKKWGSVNSCRMGSKATDVVVRPQEEFTEGTSFPKNTMSQPVMCWQLMMSHATQRSFSSLHFGRLSLQLPANAAVCQTSPSVFLAQAGEDPPSGQGRKRAQ